MFLNLESDAGALSLGYAVLIDIHLNLTVSFKGRYIDKFKDLGNFPMKVNHINKICEILDHIEKFKSEHDSDSFIDIMVTILTDLKTNSAEQHKQCAIDFVIEQLSLINCKPENYRYSPDFLIFASMLFLISPQAYKFVRKTGNIILPHPVTIKKINAKLQTNPQVDMGEPNFLSYIKKKAKYLNPDEFHVILMLDEIHIKQYLDYKGGNIAGMSRDNSDLASSAFVFMVKSILSNYKDVVYILPVKRITADTLHVILKNVIITLESVGFKVTMLVTDNNSINRKCVTQFNNPRANYVYPHPCDRNRPLFYCVDTVHLIKCVRNNWLNQKNSDQAMYFPNFELSEGDHEDATDNNVGLSSLRTVKKMYESECGNLLKFGYTLSRKALWPTNLERQDVKLALQLFNNHVANSLIELKDKCNLIHADSTALYIKIFTIWFDIVNVKTPHKGTCSRNIMQEPLTFSDADQKLIFLRKFVDWLDRWHEMKTATGKLSKETHSALILSTMSLIEYTNYCISELGMLYVLPEKVQTDDPEYRFSLYRRLAGTQYHISIRQIFEIESKIRNFSILKLTLKGTISISNFCDSIAEKETINIRAHSCFDHIHVTDYDISSISAEMPLLTYLAGYCVHSVLKRLNCQDCQGNLVIERTLSFHPDFKLIHASDRGGLRFPVPSVINIIVHNFIVVKKIIESDLEKYIFENTRSEECSFKLNSWNFKRQRYVY